MTLKGVNYHVCFGFVWLSALLFNQPFTSNCCTSPLALNKNKHTGPDKGPLLTQTDPFPQHDFKTTRCARGVKRNMLYCVCLCATTCLNPQFPFKEQI